ncbi:hypothetical protein C8K38_10633 [Rhodococcus sp. OK611]|jgi:hypothetical protein|nr:hypothetical protein C8K38_10633 [Rhodococcus sp. OK611]SNX90500.1 hypothetical protein SAMN05447004_10633 [Rhodococcus sp. OK270]
MARPTHSLSILAGEESGSTVSAIPTEYPVTMTDGVDDYLVANATEYVTAVFKLGHAEKAEVEAVDKPASGRASKSQ